MNDFGQLLRDKINVITDNWVAAVRQDRQIESADNLSPTAIQDHLTFVLEAMATVISRSQEAKLQPIVEASCYHGSLRATQGFDPTEIVREYRLLRQVIFSTLETELLQAKPLELFQVLQLVDATVDEALSQCLKSYVDERLRELKQLYSQLQLNNQELTRLVRANQDKFSHLVHELKNPLTSIIGYSDLFLLQERKSSEVKDNFTGIEHIERVLRSGWHLLHLVNDALEMSRYQEGEMKLQVAPTSIRFLVNSVVEMLEPLVREKQLELIVDCDRAPDEIKTDSLRLQQIITNLVSNALRYTHEGKVKLICKRQGSDKWALIVSDTGIGISAENKELIFDPYYRVSNKEKAYLPESTGLGLAIVGQLVQLLKGKIELMSQVGVGSTFTVTFPLAI